MRKTEGDRFSKAANRDASNHFSGYTDRTWNMIEMRDNQVETLRSQVAPLSQLKVDFFDKRNESLAISHRSL
jgi:hypothetical protein